MSTPKLPSTAPTLWRRTEPNPMPPRALVRPDAQHAWTALAEVSKDQELPCSRNPDAWFPDDSAHKQTADAIAECLTCPVVTQCREFALANNEKSGIWGGLTEQARTSELRRRYRQRDQRDQAA